MLPETLTDDASAEGCSKILPASAVDAAALSTVVFLRQSAQRYS
jgi:hypothetical protein